MISAILAVALGPQVLSGSLESAKEPQAAVTQDGRFVVTFGSKDVIFEVHETKPGVWSTPKEIAQIPGLALGMRRGPRIAIGGKTWVVAASQHNPDNSGDLIAYTSSDEGKTWTGPTRINDQKGSAGEGLDGIAASPLGDFAAVWLDSRNGSGQVEGAITRNPATDWHENRLVYRAPNGPVCPCCHPSVAWSEGSFKAMWRNSVDGNRDLYAGSLAGGTATKLGQGSWKLDACPMDGGALAVDSKGQIQAIWRRENSIFLSDLDGGKEQEIGKGVQPWMSGDWVVWLERRGGKLRAVKIGSEWIIEMDAQADDPVVAVAITRPMAFWASGGKVMGAELRDPGIHRIRLIGRRLTVSSTIVP